MRQRARRILEKEGRRQEILAAARRCLDQERFAALTMARVAEEAGLAKGTLYLYFRTKEELFLALLEDLLLAWYEALDEGLGASREALGAAEVAELVVGSLGGLPHLPRLLGLLHGILEENIDYLTALAFLECQATRVQRTGRYLEQRVPTLPEGRGVALLRRIQALVTGLWQMSDPAPAVREALGAPGLEPFKVVFDRELASSIQELIQGVQPT